MKKSFLMMLLVMGLFILIGCGKDGDDGKSYIAIDWVFTPLSYADSNSATPGTVYAGTFYRTKKGTYNFSYTAWDGSAYVGTYTIKVEEGEEGGPLPFMDGEDGEDRHYELWLYSFGPELYVSSALTEQEEEKAASLGMSAGYSGSLSTSDAPVTSADTDSLESVIHIKEKKSGNTTFRLEYQRAVQ